MEPPIIRQQYIYDPQTGRYVYGYVVIPQRIPINPQPIPLPVGRLDIEFDQPTQIIPSPGPLAFPEVSMQSIPPTKTATQRVSADSRPQLERMQGESMDVDTMLTERQQYIAPIPSPYPYSELATVPAEEDYPPPPPAMCQRPTVAKNVRLPGSVMNDVSIMKNPNVSRSRRTQAQHRVEAIMVENTRCLNANPEIVDGVRLRIFDLDTEELSELTGSPQSLISDIHADIACAVDSIIYPGSQGGVSPIMRERIRNWFTYLKQIGDTSAEGYALLSSFTDDTELFVMKSPRKLDSDDLIHEAFIGFLGLNYLRKIVPNFMYVYGYAQCSPPVLDNKQPITWCSSSEPAVSYLISENIRNSRTIKEFVADPDVTVDDLLNVLWQVWNALNVAYKTYGYTHYDLHYGNILVRDFGRPIAVPYYGIGENGNAAVGWLVSRYVAYIIDYGYSRIEVDGVGFGKIGLESAGINPNEAFPMFDTYKQIGFQAEAILRATNFNPTGTNREKLDLLQRLYDFFGEGSIVARVRTRLKGQDWYNANIKFANITHNQYMQWVIDQGLTPGLFSTDQAKIRDSIIPVLDEPIDMCRFFEMVSGSNPPDSPLEYCEAVKSIENSKQLEPQQKQESLAWLRENYSAVDNYLVSASDYSLAVAQITQDINDLLIPGQRNVLPDFEALQFTPQNAAIEGDVADYRYRILMLLSMKERNTQAISYYRSVTCMLQDQGQYQTYASDIEANMTVAVQQYNYIGSQRDILKSNLKYMDAILRYVQTNNKGIIQFWNEEHRAFALAL